MSDTPAPTSSNQPAGKLARPFPPMSNPVPAPGPATAANQEQIIEILEGIHNQGVEIVHQLGRIANR